jgi:hypothetical protein
VPGNMGTDGTYPDCFLPIWEPHAHTQASSRLLSFGKPVNVPSVPKFFVGERPVCPQVSPPSFPCPQVSPSFVLYCDEGQAHKKKTWTCTEADAFRSCARFLRSTTLLGDQDRKARAFLILLSGPREPPCSFPTQRRHLWLTLCRSCERLASHHVTFGAVTFR